MHILVVRFALVEHLRLFVTADYVYYYEEPPFLSLRNGENSTESQKPERPYELNLKNSYFLSLRNYQVNARSASEVDYPWVARVLHSRVFSKPQLCTAVCIDKQIFITAARCVVLLKIAHTSLIYQDQRLKPKAFVLPTNQSKQMFDDIALIIVHDEFTGMWRFVELLEQKRTDSAFKWFESMTFDDFEHRVVGYAKFKSDGSALAWKSPYYLTQLDVHVGLNLCREILMYNQRIDGFAVPCYHSCTLDQFGETEKPHAECGNYHGSEGSAIINLKTKKLLGVATWGAYYHKYELPVGFSIPNSDSFFEDKICAEKIRDDQDFFVDPGFYQDLCDGNARKFNSQYLGDRASLGPNCEGRISLNSFASR